MPICCVDHKQNNRKHLSDQARKKKHKNNCHQQCKNNASREGRNKQRSRTLC